MVFTLGPRPPVLTNVYSSSARSGTMTFEQPIGSTPVVRPCGPS